MISKGFSRSRFDSCVYFKRAKNGNMIYLLIYMDDMIVISNDLAYITSLKNALKSEFEMKDLGATKRILGIDIFRDRNRGILTLSQAGYIQEVLKEFGMMESKSVSTQVSSHYKLKSA